MQKYIKKDNVFSAVISGIQWDVVMKFVNGKPDGQEQPSLFNVMITDIQECSPNQEQIQQTRYVIFLT